MKRTTITIPDELQDALEQYARRQEEPPELTAVVEKALREFLERREQVEDVAFLPFRITPARVGSGHSDISVNHDAYFADDEHNDSTTKP